MDLLLPASLMFNNITKIYFTNATGVNIYLVGNILLDGNLNEKLYF